MPLLPPRLRRTRSRLPKQKVVCAIRPARVEDYAALCAIFGEGDSLHSTALPDVFCSSGGLARSREYISDALNREDSAIFVAVIQGTEQRPRTERPAGQVVGAIHVLVREAPAIPLMVERRFAVIDNITVTRRSRRQGIGRALLEHAERWAQARGVTQVELNVWEFNKTARLFYQRLGYRTISRRLRRQLGSGSR